jgi:hypothetical protein
MKKFIIRVIIICAFILAMAFFPPLLDFTMALFIPPQIYIVLGLIMILILLKILYEVRRK